MSCYLVQELIELRAIIFVCEASWCHLDCSFGGILLLDTKGSRACGVCTSVLPWHCPCCCLSGDCSSYYYLTKNIHVCILGRLASFYAKSTPVVGENTAQGRTFGTPPATSQKWKLLFHFQPWNTTTVLFLREFFSSGKWVWDHSVLLMHMVFAYSLAFKA